MPLGQSLYFDIFFFISEQYEESIEVTRKALKHLPEEAQLFFNLGNVYGKQGRFEESERNFLKAISLKPSIAKFYANLGMCAW